MQKKLLDFLPNFWKSIFESFRKGSFPFDLHPYSSFQKQKEVHSFEENNIVGTRWKFLSLHAWKQNSFFCQYARYKWYRPAFYVHICMYVYQTYLQPTYYLMACQALRGFVDDFFLPFLQISSITWIQGTVIPRYSVPRNSDFPRYSDFFAAYQFLMY